MRIAHVRSYQPVDNAPEETVRVDVRGEAYLDDIALFENKKEYVKWVFREEKLIRDSFELTDAFEFLKSSRGMDHCGVHQNLGRRNGFRIELHHTPFTLHDIVDIVTRKRLEKNQSLKMQHIASEVVELHYLELVGLYPLCSICHAQVHNPKLDPMFIPLDRIWGSPDEFSRLYWDYFSDSMKAKWQTVESLNKGYNLIDEQLPLELQKKYIYIKPYDDEETQVVGTTALIDFINQMSTPEPPKIVHRSSRDEDGFYVLHRAS